MNRDWAGLRFCLFCYICELVLFVVWNILLLVSVEELIEYVYEESDDYALHHVEIRPQVIDTPDEVTEHDVVFDAIQDEVVQGIRDAKFIIWAAVAWFSNEAIYQELLAKKKQGLNIRIIVSQEDSNTNMISKLRDNKFDIVVIPRWGSRGYNRIPYWKNAG